MSESGPSIVLTCRAMRFESSRTRPSLPRVKTAPMGAVSFVAVTTVTDSQSAHSADNASPRNPNVETRASSSSEGSLEVWCFSPVGQLLGRRQAHIPMEGQSSCSIPEPLSTTSMLSRPLSFSRTSASQYEEDKTTFSSTQSDSQS